MYQYEINFESVSGDTHSIELLHEENMSDEEFREKCIRIAQTLPLDARKDLRHINGSGFPLFVKALLNNGFQEVESKTVASTSLAGIAYGVEYLGDGKTMNEVLEMIKF